MRLVFILALLLCTAVPALADTQAGLIGTPDERAILISKDVGGARWAITLSLVDEAPLTITGNVFNADGGAAFVYCVIVDIDGTADDIAHAMFHYQCYGNNACHVPGQCPAWTTIPGDVAIEGSFFIPR